MEKHKPLPDVWFGEYGKRPDFGHDYEPDDDPKKTPPDVVEALGFDPMEDEDSEDD